MTSRKTNPKVGVYRPDSPYSEKECEEIIQKLELFLDGQLKGKEKEEVEQLIQQCEYCAEQYQFERKLRTLLSRSWQHISQEAQDIVANVRRRIWGDTAG
uniref:Zinc-finger domain-containing protein n=1 Tax=uncultured Bacteroidota bacterium TaxID=152509 RepID=H5SIF1_9BACT|nr:hypothetical protein HGMM_F32H02C10 [uncultured Bacteroidetes bacterium]